MDRTGRNEWRIGVRHPHLYIPDILGLPGLVHTVGETARTPIGHATSFKRVMSPPFACPF